MLPHFSEDLVSSQVIYSTVHFMAFYHWNNNRCQKSPKISLKCYKVKYTQIRHMCSHTQPAEHWNTTTTYPPCGLWLARPGTFKNIFDFFRYFFYEWLQNYSLSPHLALASPSHWAEKMEGIFFLKIKDKKRNLQSDRRLKMDSGWRKQNLTSHFWVWANIYVQRMLRIWCLC